MKRFISLLTVVMVIYTASFSANAANQSQNQTKASYQQTKEKVKAQCQQNLIQSGLGGTTLMAGFDARYEQEVGNPTIDKEQYQQNRIDRERFKAKAQYQQNLIDRGLYNTTLRAGYAAESGLTSSGANSNAKAKNPASLQRQDAQTMAYIQSQKKDVKQISTTAIYEQLPSPYSGSSENKLPYKRSGKYSGNNDSSAVSQLGQTKSIYNTPPGEFRPSMPFRDNLKDQNQAMAQAAQLEKTQALQEAKRQEAKRQEAESKERDIIIATEDKLAGGPGVVIGAISSNSDGNKSFCMILGHIYRQGETINGFKIHKISASEVIFEKNGKTFARGLQ